jgi:hypothetical protein
MPSRRINCHAGLFWRPIVLGLVALLASRDQVPGLRRRANFGSTTSVNSLPWNFGCSTGTCGYREDRCSSLPPACVRGILYPPVDYARLVYARKSRLVERTTDTWPSSTS